MNSRIYYIGLNAENSFVRKLPLSGYSQMVYEKRGVIMLKHIS